MSNWANIDYYYGHVSKMKSGKERFYLFKCVIMLNSSASNTVGSRPTRLVIFFGFSYYETQN